MKKLPVSPTTDGEERKNKGPVMPRPVAEQDAERVGKVGSYRK